VVFDFDDTLVESETIKDGIFREIFARFPASAYAAWEFHRQNGSQPRAEKFAWLAAREYPDDKERQGKCLRDCLQVFAVQARAKVTLAPEVCGAGHLLAQLAGQVPTYVASVNPQEELEFQIHHRGWERHFKGWYGNPPFAKGEALREIAKREGVRTQDLLLIGDSQGDKAAAEQAGSQVWLRGRPGKPGNWEDGRDLATKLKLPRSGSPDQ